MLYSILDKFLMNDFSDAINNNLNKDKEKITVFDIGCFQGNFSRKLKKKINSSKVDFYLFDPNTKLKIPDFNYHKFAFSNKQETTTYYLNDFFPASGSSLKTIIKNDKLWNFTRRLVTLNFKKSFSEHKVKTETLDNFCDINNIKEIDILKIDAEGAELDILIGGKEILKNTNIIQVEILGLKSDFKENYSKVCSLLENEYNFEMKIKKNIWSLSQLSSMRACDLLFVKKS